MQGALLWTKMRRSHKYSWWESSAPTQTSLLPSSRIFKRGNNGSAWSENYKNTVRSQPDLLLLEFYYLRKLLRQLVKPTGKCQSCILHHSPSRRYFIEQKKAVCEEKFFQMKVIAARVVYSRTRVVLGGCPGAKECENNLSKQPVVHILVASVLKGCDKSSLSLHFLRISWWSTKFQNHSKGSYSKIFKVTE